MFDDFSDLAEVSRLRVTNCCRREMRWVFAIYTSLIFACCSEEDNIQVRISFLQPRPGDFLRSDTGNLNISVLFVGHRKHLVIGIRVGDLLDAAHPDPNENKHLARGELGLTVIDTVPTSTDLNPIPFSYTTRLQLNSTALWCFRSLMFSLYREERG